MNVIRCDSDGVFFVRRLDDLHWVDVISFCYGFKTWIIALNGGEIYTCYLFMCAGPF